MIEPFELQELRIRADLPSMLRNEGIRLSPASSGFRGPCPLHGGDNPTAFSLFRDASRVWKWKCHSHDCGSGDAIEYLRKRYQMSFQEAIDELSFQTGYTPTTSSQHSPTPRARSSAVIVAQEPPLAVETPSISTQEQATAVAAFLEMARKFPSSQERAYTYVHSRGIPTEVLEQQGGAVALVSADIEHLTRWLSRPENSPAADRLLSAGLLKKKSDSLRLNWWGSVILFPCLTPEGQAQFLTGRRLDWTEGEKYGKYIHQSTSQGAKLYPYGLPSLESAARQGKSLLVVEGVFDALGAQTLGFPAIAMLQRPQARGWTDLTSLSIRALSPYLPSLRRCARVDVVPDQDGGESESVGWRKAEGLTSWLREFGIDSSVLSLTELGFGGCKDFGEAVERASK
jgi:DNA primase